MPLIIVYIFYKLAVTTLSMIKVLRNCATKEHNTKERWEKNISLSSPSNSIPHLNLSNNRFFKQHSQEKTI
jgi:hypothetical protein